MIPKLQTCPLELFFAQRFQADDVIFVRHFIHLGMNEKLASISFYCYALFAFEVHTSIAAISATVVVCADPAQLRGISTMISVRVVRACVQGFLS
jgi:hypothetical protein